MIMATQRLVFMVLVVGFFAQFSSVAASEAEILLRFKKSLSNASALSNWDVSTSPPCTGNTSNWNGPRCEDDGTISALILEDMGLMGLIDMDSLVLLPSLRYLSFANNSFNGPIPNVKRLSSLKTFYLSNNRFSGEILDDAFDSMNSLKKVYLNRNKFTGKIPTSLANLPKLVELDLEWNQFEGKIPNFKEDLTVVNLANNQLEGAIPASLSIKDASSFAGNLGLCGKPLVPCKKSKKRSFIIIVIVVAAVAIVLLLLGIAVVLFMGRRGHRAKTPKRFGQNPTAKAQNKFKNGAAVYGGGGGGQKEVISSPGGRGGRGGGDYKQKGDQGNLYFVRNGRERFELQDLLRASAEVLGSGSSFGSSYKAVLLSGPAMVVKRFRQMNNVGKEEFHEHMKKLGKLAHPNLLPLVAFYYRQEEKLLISDFVENGCLASHLHGKREPGQPGLDWPTRLRIIKGVAKGLAYLYKEFPTLTLPHGHLKSSNVLLDDTFQPLLMDYALSPIIDKDHAQEFMVAYKSPEFTHTTKKTDIWSLGILILEMLTGKYPANYMQQSGSKGTNNADLAAWVNSVVREEWTGEVFDKDMKGTRNGQGEMLKLLKIGMGCCEWEVEKRWDLKEVMEKIEELKERGIDEDYSSYASEGDMYYSSSRVISEDDFSFSITK